MCCDQECDGTTYFNIVSHKHIIIVWIDKSQRDPVVEGAIIEDLYISNMFDHFEPFTLQDSIVFELKFGGSHEGMTGLPFLS
jgi:hypothetical protein